MRFTRDSQRKVKAAVDLTPLIDVVFQLLLFFMLSATFVVQTSIPIEMAQSRSSEQMEEKQMTITIKVGTGGPDAQGDIIIDEDVAIESWDELTAKLMDLHTGKPDALVLIRPEKGVPYQRLINVLDRAREAGIQRYGLAVEKYLGTQPAP